MASFSYPTQPLAFEEYPNSCPFYITAGLYISSSNLINYEPDPIVNLLLESPFHTPFVYPVTSPASESQHGRLHVMGFTDVHISQVLHMEAHCVLHDEGVLSMYRPTCHPRKIGLS